MILFLITKLLSIHHIMAVQMITNQIMMLTIILKLFNHHHHHFHHGVVSSMINQWHHCRTQLWLDVCLALAYLSSGVLCQLCIFIITTSATLTTGHMDAAFIVCDILWPCCYNGQALCMACPYRLINNNAISVFYGILHDLSYLIIRISCQYRNGKIA